MRISDWSSDVCSSDLELGAGSRDRFRVDHTGYIFQQFNLLPFLSVRENVELPCHFSKLRAQRAIQRHGSVDQAAATLLAHLGLTDTTQIGRASCRERVCQYV